MPVLKTKSKRGKHILLGASMPSWVHVYLSLYGLAKRTSKSDIIKLLMNDWINRMRVVDNETNLVQEIAEQIHILWATEKRLQKKNTYEEFKEKIESELHRKGIPDNYIRLIFKKI